MSVINQMLKDLDKRQQTERLSNEATTATIVPEAKKLSLPVVITVILLMNIAGIAIWQLYSENQQLKARSSITTSEKTGRAEHSKQAVITEPVEQAQKALLTADNQVKSEPSQTQNYNELTSSAAPQSASQTTRSKAATNPVQNGSQTMPANSVENSVEPLASRSNQQSDRALSSALANNRNQNIEQQASQISPATAQQQNKPQLTISRKQLSSQELVAQKLSQAQQALSRDQVSRAETLFEDVLLVSPENKTARKQLAALWFGRKSYQAAHNLLSQGIAISPDDGEYRMMKARIYLGQGQQSAALDVLKVLPNLKNIEYQALLATNAQQLAQYDVAITAYRLLTALQSDNGRWWLGLAVAYDSDSQFDNAAKAYYQAKDNSELSASARQFVRQRLQELGE